MLSCVCQQQTDSVNEKVYWRKIVPTVSASDHGGMVKGPPRVANRPNKQPGTGGRRTKGDELFIGPWLHALDLTQARVADDAGIGKPYMSQLVSGKYDKEPGHGVVRRIAQAMKITVDDLYKMPPPKKDLAPWRDVSAQARDALLAREMK